jgi:hypothetical protein
MVHKIEEKKKGFSATIVGFFKNDPLVKPLFPEEEENTEGKKKESLGDNVGTDL